MWTRRTVRHSAVGLAFLWIAVLGGCGVAGGTGDGSTTNAQDGSAAIANGTARPSESAAASGSAPTAASSAAPQSAEVPVSAFSCPPDEVTDVQVRTVHGGAVVCHVPGIVQQGEITVVNTTYDGGRPQTIDLVGGPDIVKDGLSASDLSDSSRTIYISRYLVDFSLNQQQQFEDPVVEILVDGAGGVGVLPTPVNSSPSSSERDLAGSRSADPAPTACPDVTSELSSALGTPVVENHADAYISDAAEGDISCEWRLTDRLRNGYPVLLVVLIRPDADWAEELAGLSGTVTPVPRLGPHAVYVADSALSTRIVAAEVNGIYVRVLFKESDVTQQEIVTLVGIIQQAMVNQY